VGWGRRLGNHHETKHPGAKLETNSSNYHDKKKVRGRICFRKEENGSVLCWKTATRPRAKWRYGAELGQRLHGTRPQFRMKIRSCVPPSRWWHSCRHWDLRVFRAAPAPIPPLVPPLSFARACDSARGGHLQRAELPRALVASRWFEFGVRWQLLTPL